MSEETKQDQPQFILVNEYMLTWIPSFRLWIEKDGVCSHEKVIHLGEGFPNYTSHCPENLNLADADFDEWSAWYGSNFFNICTQIIRNVPPGLSLSSDIGGSSTPNKMWKWDEDGWWPEAPADETGTTHIDRFEFDLVEPGTEGAKQIGAMSFKLEDGAFLHWEIICVRVCRSKDILSFEDTDGVTPEFRPKLADEWEKMMESLS